MACAPSANNEYLRHSHTHSQSFAASRRPNTDASSNPHTAPSTPRAPPPPSPPSNPRFPAAPHTDAAASVSSPSLPFAFLRDCSAFGCFNSLYIIRRAVILQPPAPHIARLALLDAHNYIAVPRPRMIPVKLARHRRAIGVRMIPADQINLLLACGLLRHPHVVRRHLKPVPRRIVPSVLERHQINHFTRRAGAFPLAPQYRATAFIRVRLFAVRLDAPHQLLRNLQRRLQLAFNCRIAHSSLQNRSLRYFSPESGRIVTITARSPRGTRFATSRQAHTAAPALTPTRIPSSRASRFATQ